MNDADLIRRMTAAYIGRGATIFENVETGMARVLAVVRAHDAGPARRVPVQIVNMTLPGDASDTIIALASDGSLHRGKCGDDGFLWGDQFPPLPQPGDGA